MTGVEFAADTSAVVALLRGDTTILRMFHAARAVFLPFPTRAELLLGARLSRRTEENLPRVEELLAQWETIPWSEDTERRYVEIKLSLRQRGRPIPITTSGSRRARSQRIYRFFIGMGISPRSTSFGPFRFSLLYRSVNPRGFSNTSTRIARSEARPPGGRAGSIAAKPSPSRSA